MRRPRHLRPRRLAPRNPLRHREMLNPARLTGRTRYLMRIWTDIGAQFPTSSLVFFLFRASTMPIPGTGSASDDRGGRRRRGGADPLLTSRLGSNSLRDLGGRLRDRLLAVGCAGVARRCERGGGGACRDHDCDGERRQSAAPPAPSSRTETYRTPSSAATSTAAADAFACLPAFVRGARRLQAFSQGT